MRKPKSGNGARVRRRVTPPTAEQIAALVRLGVPYDLATRVDQNEAITMIRHAAVWPDRNAATKPAPRKSTPLASFAPEDGEATDGQLLALKRLGGKYGSHHRRR